MVRICSKHRKPGGLVLYITHFGVVLVLVALGLFVLRSRPTNWSTVLSQRRPCSSLDGYLGSPACKQANTWLFGHDFRLRAQVSSPLHLCVLSIAIRSRAHARVPDSEGDLRFWRRVYAAVATKRLARLRHRRQSHRRLAQVWPALSLLCALFHRDLLLRPLDLSCKWRSCRGLERAQLQYLGAGIVTGFAGGICTNLVVPLVTGQSKYSWMGPYFSLAYVGFVAHAIIRHRFMDLRLFIHRGLTITIAIALSALPAGVLLAIFWPRLLVHLDVAELTLLLTAVGIVTILTPITRDAASRLLDRYVYRTHANSQRTFARRAKMLTRVLHLETLLRFICSTVRGSLESRA